LVMKRWRRACRESSAKRACGCAADLINPSETGLAFDPQPDPDASFTAALQTAPKPSSPAVNA